MGADSGAGAGHPAILDIPGQSSRITVGKMATPWASPLNGPPIILMPIRRLALLLPLVAAAGCGSSDAPGDATAAAPAAARYPVRSDLMVADEKASLGSPPRWPSAGFLPLRSLRLPARTPDPDIAATLQPAVSKKDIVDPTTNLTELQRDDIGRLLDQFFGTPAAPRVKVPGVPEMTAAWPPFAPGDEI